jgi:hypothetical protein
VNILEIEIYLKFAETFYTPEKIRYIHILNKQKEKVFDNIIEIDVNEAYWKTAKILGVIDDNLYNAGSKENSKISKKTRLIALGSLAKKTDVYHFKGSRIVKHEVIRSYLTENVWYSICKTLSDAMWEARKIAGNDFFLFWVDGIYIKNNPEKAKAIKEHFESLGYDVKFKENLSIHYSEKAAIVTNKKNGAQRPFYLPKDRSTKKFYPDRNLKEICLKYIKYQATENENEDYEEI